MKQSRLLRTLCIAVSALLLHGILCSRSRGAAGDVDLSFDPGSGLDDLVTALALQPDGKVIISGGFRQVRGLARYRLARLNADGSGDASFNAAIAGAGSIVVQVDGRMILANGEGIHRLLADGSVDSSFIHPVLTDYLFNSAAPYAVALQPDGKILISGAFQIVNGAFRSGMARLHPDGSLDDTFVPATSDYPDSGIYSIVVQPDGKVLIGGQSVTSNGVSLVRLNADGSLDSSFRSVVVFDPSWPAPLDAVALQPDGKVLIGGRFIFFYDATGGGITPFIPRHGIARIKGDGSLDDEFVPGEAAGGWTQSINVLPDGRIIAERHATIAKVICLFTDGSVDDTFAAMTGHPAVSAIVIQPDGRILAGGVGDSQPITSALSRFDADGVRDQTFIAGGGVGTIYSLKAQPDGKVILGGAIGPRASGSITRLNQDGSWDDTFHSAPNVPADGWRILLQRDGRILLGGYSSTADDEGTVTGRGEITCLHPDGSLDISFHAGVGVPGGFHLMALQPDGKIFACGETTEAEIRYKTLARLNSDGSKDESFQPLAMEVGSLPDLNCVAVQADGKVLVGGRFSIRQDPGIYSLIRLHADGTMDGTFHHASRKEHQGIEVRSLITRDDGMILVAGALMGSDGVISETVARLQSDGQVDRSFDPGPGVSIYTATTDGGGIAWQPDGRVIASGYYRPETEEHCSGPVRFNVDGSLDRSFKIASGYFEGNYCLELQADGNVLVGGPFITIHGILRPHVARLSGDPRLPVPFTVWAAGYGLTGDNAAADADPDQDGGRNAVEYVLGSNPALSTSGERPSIKLNGSDMLFTFPRDDASETPGVSVAVEAGTDLVAWPRVFTIGPDTDSSSPGVSIAENGALPDMITVIIQQGTSTHRFVRLKVTIAP